MTRVEVISLIVTIVSLLCFSCVFTVLFSSYCKTSSEEVLSGKKDIELLDTVLIEKRQAEKKKKPNKILSICKKIGSYFVLGILAITLCSSLYSRITNDLMPVFDTAVLTIKTGSMSKKHESNDYLYTYNLNDQFNAFDMIFVERVENQDELKEYDVIAYRNESDTIIIHRIVKIVEDEEGVRHFYTRGDANEPMDTYVSTYEDVVGIYKGNRIPVLGIFVLFLQSYSGLVTVVAVIYCIWMFNRQYGKFKKTCDDRIDILLSLIIDPLDVNELKTSYIQYIYYRGSIYEFNDGKFVRKGNETLTDENNIYFVSNKDEIVEVEAKNVDDNVVITLSDEDKLNAIEKIKNKIEE